MTTPAHSTSSDAPTAARTISPTSSSKPGEPEDLENDVGNIIMNLFTLVQGILPEAANQLKLALIRVRLTALWLGWLID